MANRFPLIVNPDTKEIQEIAQNDNLDLTGNGVYAGGSLGSNGQVLSSNGTTVEWRTLSGGGSGGGIDLNTTYVLETEELADGINLNLIAGGTGVGTLSIKYEDTTEIQFDAPDNLTLQAYIKDASIANTKLVNNSITMNINGVNTDVALGDTISIPIYGDVFKTSTQELSNKSFKDCSFSFSSGTGNTIGSIPNDALLNHSITINGTEVDLGGSITVSGGGGGGGATYSISAEDWSENGVDVPDKKAIRLSGSDSTTDNVLLVAGDRISLTRNGDEITITGDEVDTDTDTTYTISADTFIQNSANIGARLKLIDSNTNSDIINLRSGTGVTVNSTADNEIRFDIAQDISSTSNVTFNNLEVTGGITVTGALSYINTTNLKVTDKTLTIADGVVNTIQADGSGILLGTSNINFTYDNQSLSWQSTANMNLVPTKVYKIGGTEVLSSTRIFGKTSPSGDFVGTSDYQSLTNKTIISPVMTEIINTGTVAFPAPTVADTLVGRATQDILTNKTINGDVNTLENIGNSSLSNSYMIINGTQRNLGDTFTVTATDPYTDEKAQDTVAGMITSATHSGISWVYDDTTGTLAATVAGGSGGSFTLSGLTDTDLTTTAPVTGDVLTYDGTNWIPALTPTNTVGNFSGTFTGNITAGVVTSDSFVKNGGTSSEYLMADGSVSSGPIVTTSTTGNFSGTFTGNLDAGLVTSDSFVKNGGTSSEYLMADGSVSTTLNMGGTMTASILPDTNAAYDLGSAEYKIRHLYLSQNTLYYEGEYLKVAQHNAGQGAGQASYLLPLSKIKEVLNASTDFASFKAAILAIDDVPLLP